MSFKKSPEDLLKLQIKLESPWAERAGDSSTESVHSLQYLTEFVKETSNSDVESMQFPKSDYVDFKKCLLCETSEKDSSYPYCLKCFTWKKSVFRNRPKRNKNNIKKNIMKENVEKMRENSEGHNLSNDSGIRRSYQEAQASSHSAYQPCRVCSSKPENGLFLHTKSAHLYGCYSCANDIWLIIKKCPLCRKKVYKVSKLF